LKARAFHRQRAQPQHRDHSRGAKYEDVDRAALTGLATNRSIVIL